MMLHYWPELGIPIGAVPGGMGGITAALARCARSHGAEVRTEAEVARVIVREERAAGVELLNGEVLNARVVLSNADPKRSLLGLLEPDHLEESFRRRLSSVRSEGIVFKINLALSELPDFTAIPARSSGPSTSVLSRSAPRSTTSKGPGTTPSSGRRPGSHTCTA